MDERNIPIPEDISRQEIIRAEVGSTLYGTGLPGTEDTDYMGVCVEPWQAIFGLQRFEQWQWRTQPEGVRSGFGDIDITVFGLRKFMHLACKGNPSILLLLFVPEDRLVVQTPLGRSLQVLARDIVSARVAAPYIGYATAQLDQLTGKRGGKHGKSRPELVEQFGYDTKFAMHALRLALQGCEILRTGRIEVPIPNPDGDLLRAVRRGDLDLTTVVELIETGIEGIRKAEMETRLPGAPRYGNIQHFMRHARMVTYGDDF